MKNKPDPGLSGGSFLFNEIKKRTSKSRETIPLNIFFEILLHLSSKIAAPAKLETF
jgi:hypothetical protein